MSTIRYKSQATSLAAAHCASSLIKLPHIFDISGFPIEMSENSRDPSIHPFSYSLYPRIPIPSDGGRIIRNGFSLTAFFFVIDDPESMGPKQRGKSSAYFLSFCRAMSQGTGSFLGTLSPHIFI
ncbi:hypothetical protein TWF569_011125 [Orbilia oligospora]|nr:hypothetical protein TWF569_011125 [Orbilia oligospora]KAF3142947.1 hypothetical protein TWF594_005337 [Orbilia oligospora]